METPFKTIIIDDEQNAVELLKALLDNISEVQIEKTFTSPLEALKYLAINKINLIFLDIQMPELSGIDFAKKLIELNIKSSVVFITAHEQYILEALRVNAIDYLLKPVDIIELKETILRIIQRGKDEYSDSLSNFLKSNQRRKLKFNTRNGFITFFEDEILFVKADGV